MESEGNELHRVHELFDQVATEIEDHTDMIAVRVSVLGGTDEGTARVLAEIKFEPESHGNN